MKKLLAVLLALLCLCACAFAEETAEPAEVLDIAEIVDRGIYLTSLTDDQGNALYDVYMDELPEEAVLTFHEELTEDGIWQVEMEGVADVYVAVSECDLENAAGVSMADVTGENFEQLKAMATIDFEDPEVEMLTTPSGNQYMRICEKDESVRNVCTMFTLYKGAIIQLVQYNDDFAPLTDADNAAMESVLHAIWVYPAE